MAKIVQFQAVPVSQTMSTNPAGGSATQIAVRLWVLDDEGRVWHQDQHGQMKMLASGTPEKG